MPDPSRSDHRPPPTAPHAPLAREIDRQRRRHQAAAEGERSFFQGLGIIGGLGWMIVLPTLGGLALGRWIDGRLGTGITATGALLVVGLALGCRLAWQRIHHP